MSYDYWYLSDNDYIDFLVREFVKQILSQFQKNIYKIDLKWITNCVISTFKYFGYVTFVIMFTDYLILKWPYFCNVFIQRQFL